MATDPKRDDLGGKGIGFDLLTIGLLVFFISLLVTVAALLTLPMILG
ncbi:MAG TPA: hypothetical protein VF153_05855 [Candidatus Limnocylindria bacterium]